MSALTCGVDIGSTNVKVTLVDEGGHAVWTKAVPTPRLPDDGGVATDALGLVAMIEEMIVTGWHMHGGSLPLRAIAAAGVGEDGVGVRADLTPTGLRFPGLTSGPRRRRTIYNELPATLRRRDWPSIIPERQLNGYGSDRTVQGTFHPAHSG